MATQYYYNGVKLPKIPEDVLAEYPFCWIRKHTTSGNYDLVFTAKSWYYNPSDNDNDYVVSSAGDQDTAQWYILPIATSDSATSWTFKESTVSNFLIDNTRIIIWSNHNIPNGSATSTEIYFYGSEPVPVQTEPAPTDTVTIEYNGSVIASLKAGQTATLPCKDKPMHTDVVVTVPDGLGGSVEEWDGSYTIEV